MGLHGRYANPELLPEAPSPREILCLHPISSLIAVKQTM